MVTAADRGGLKKLAGVAKGGGGRPDGLANFDWNCGGRMEPGIGILLLALVPIRGIRDCVGSFDIFSSK